MTELLHQIATAAVAIGALSAVAGIWRSNPTAMALLASAIVSSGYCGMVESGVWEYRPVLLIALDVLVIIWIIVGWADAVAKGRYGRRRDLAIIALFVPIWPLYYDNRWWTDEAIDILIAVQMLLSFPIRTLWAEARKRWPKLAKDDTGSMLVWQVARA